MTLQPQGAAPWVGYARPYLSSCIAVLSVYNLMRGSINPCGQCLKLGKHCAHSTRLVYAPRGKPWCGAFSLNLASGGSLSHDFDAHASNTALLSTSVSGWLAMVSSTSLLGLRSSTCFVQYVIEMQTFEQKNKYYLELRTITPDREGPSGGPSSATGDLLLVPRQHAYM